MSRTATKPSSLATAGRLTALLAGALLCARAVIDPDLWGHLTFGADILASRRITTVDPYSFTQDVPWVNHEWLSEVGFALAYRLGGVAGLVVLKTLLLGTTLWLMWRELRLVSDPSKRWWLLALLGFALAPAGTSFRPQLWTLLALAVTVCLLAGRAALLWLVPVFAAWGNLHGGWIVGVGLVSSTLAGRLLDGVPLRRLTVPALLLVVAVAATIVNPYGAGLWHFLSGTVRMTREISEWRPVWEQSDYSHALLWLLVFAAFAASVWQRWRVIPWASLVPAAGLCVASLWVDRLGPLFAIVSVPLWRDAWLADSTHAPVPLPTPRPAGPPLWIVDAAAMAAVWLVVAGGAARCLAIQGEWVPDLRAAAALRSASPGRLMVPFDWGEYAIWHFGPALRVSMDGRRETVYSQRTIELQDAVMSGAPDGMAYLLRERPEYVWMKSDAVAVRDVLSGAGYRVDIITSRSFVASRSDLPALRPADAMPSCFP